MKEKNHDDDIEINERQILAKQKLKIAFQRLLEQLEEQLNVFENTATVRYNKWQLENQEAIKAEDYAKIKPYKPDMSVEKMRMNLIITIAEIQDAMAANEIAPTIEERSESAVIDRIKKRTNKLLKKGNEAKRNLVPLDSNHN